MFLYYILLYTVVFSFIIFIILYETLIIILTDLRYCISFYYITLYVYYMYFLLYFTLVEWPAQLNPSSWTLCHLQESTKNTSLPSLFDPLTLALYSNSILAPFRLALYSFTNCLFSLKNTSLLYSFSIPSVFFLFIIYKKSLLSVLC